MNMSEFYCDFVVPPYSECLAFYDLVKNNFYLIFL